ncbi:MAG: prepilin-type N-terminal cleavage/methylation domain-containing protein [Candidatus Paceibacterota bacterium]|jgi:prepilin-type N-terminal cleavage/methylation domain-containing protein
MERLHDNKGFVLTELLVSIAILAILAIAVSSFSRDVFSLNAYNQERLIASDELRRGLKQFTAELRTAEPSDAGDYLFIVASSSAITFFSDVNGDGTHEKVRYYMSGNILKRGIISPTLGSPPTYNLANEKIIELVHTVTNGSAIFSYYPDTYTGNSAPFTQPVPIDQVRLVKVNVSVDPDPNRSPAPIVDGTQVTIRNLKDNL